MITTQIIQWLNRELQLKKQKIQSLKELKSGVIFLQLLHGYYPKNVNLKKIYSKPKNTFQLMQNYKQLAHAFCGLKWNKIDPEKYAKQQDKDCIDIANVIINKIKALKSVKFDQDEKKSVDVSMYNKIAEQSENMDNKVLQLQKKHQKLLNKLRSIQQIVNNASDQNIARNLIVQIISQ